MNVLNPNYWTIRELSYKGDFFFFLNILSIYLAAPGLSFSMQDLSLQHVNCELLVAACGT